MAAYCRPIISICFIKNGRDPNKRTKWILKNSYFYSGFRSRSQNASGHGCPVQGVYQMEIWGGFFFVCVLLLHALVQLRKWGWRRGGGRKGEQLIICCYRNDACPPSLSPSPSLFTPPTLSSSIRAFPRCMFETAFI